MKPRVAAQIIMFFWEGGGGGSTGWACSLPGAVDTAVVVALYLFCLSLWLVLMLPLLYPCSSFSAFRSPSSSSWTLSLLRLSHSAVGSLRETFACLCLLCWINCCHCCCWDSS